MCLLNFTLIIIRVSLTWLSKKRNTPVTLSQITTYLKNKKYSIRINFYIRNMNKICEIVSSENLSTAQTSIFKKY